MVPLVPRGGDWHKASVSDCLPLAAPIGLWPLLILTLCGPERVLVVSTEPPDDLSCLTTPGVGRPADDGAGGGVLSEMHCTTRRGVVQGVGARRVGSVRRVVQCRTRRRGPTRRGCTTRRTVSYKVSYSTNTVRHSTT